MSSIRPFLILGVLILTPVLATADNPPAPGFNLAGSDAQASKTQAVLEDGDWTINGSKIFITNASTTMSAVCTVQ